MAFSAELKRSDASVTEAEDRAAFPSGRDGTTTFEVDAPRPTRRQNKTRPIGTCRAGFVRRERFPPSSHPTTSPLPLSLLSVRSPQLALSSARRFLEAREGAALSGRAGTARLRATRHEYQRRSRWLAQRLGMRTSARSVRPTAAAAAAAGERRRRSAATAAKAEAAEGGGIRIGEEEKRKRERERRMR